MSDTTPPGEQIVAAGTGRPAWTTAPPPPNPARDGRGRFTANTYQRTATPDPAGNAAKAAIKARQQETPTPWSGSATRTDGQPAAPQATADSARQRVSNPDGQGLAPRSIPDIGAYATTPHALAANPAQRQQNQATATAHSRYPNTRTPHDQNIGQPRASPRSAQSLCGSSHAQDDPDPARNSISAWLKTVPDGHEPCDDDTTGFIQPPTRCPATTNDRVINDIEEEIANLTREKEHRLRANRTDLRMRHTGAPPAENHLHDNLSSIKFEAPLGHGHRNPVPEDHPRHTGAPPAGDHLQGNPSNIQPQPLPGHGYRGLDGNTHNQHRHSALSPPCGGSAASSYTTSIPTVGSNVTIVGSGRSGIIVGQANADGEVKVALVPDGMEITIASLATRPAPPSTNGRIWREPTPMPGSRSATPQQDRVEQLFNTTDEGVVSVENCSPSDPEMSAGGELVMHLPRNLTRLFKQRGLELTPGTSHGDVRLIRDALQTYFSDPKTKQSSAVVTLPGTGKVPPDVLQDRRELEHLLHDIESVTKHPNDRIRLLRESLSPANKRTLEDFIDRSSFANPGIMHLVNVCWQLMRIMAKNAGGRSSSAAKLAQKQRILNSYLVQTSSAANKEKNFNALVATMTRLMTDIAWGGDAREPRFDPSHPASGAAFMAAILPGVDESGKMLTSHIVYWRELEEACRRAGGTMSLNDIARYIASLDTPEEKIKFHARAGTPADRMSEALLLAVGEPLPPLTRGSGTPVGAYQPEHQPRTDGKKKPWWASDCPTALTAIAHTCPFCAEAKTNANHSLFDCAEAMKQMKTRCLICLKHGHGFASCPEVPKVLGTSARNRSRPAKQIIGAIVGITHFPNHSSDNLVEHSVMCMQAKALASGTSSVALSSYGRTECG